MTATRDWGHELVESLWWLLRAFGISAAALLLVAFLLIRFTAWGRQFWRLGRGNFTGRRGVTTWVMFVGLLLLTLGSVRLDVLLSYQGNQLYTGLQTFAEGAAQGDSATAQSGKDSFWNAILVFGVLATIFVVRALVAYYLGQAFDIRWRLQLTDHVITDWMKGQAYYRNRFIDNTIDNPDQRIQSDITDYVQVTRSLSLGAVSSIASIIAFTQILWGLSGPLDIFGVTVSHALVWLAYSYVLVSTVIAFWIGRPLIRLNFLNEAFNATFRYALVRVRDGAENVAFYRGETVERHGLLFRFAGVIANYWRLVNRTLFFSGWNLVVSQISAVFAIIIQAPRFFNGTLSLGDLTQSSSAFSSVHDSLSFFRESYDTFAGYRATLIRLDGLMDADQKSRELPRVGASADDSISLHKVAVETPVGVRLIDNLSVRLTRGESLVVKGNSGSGKTTLLRALAEMWPYAEGVVDRPEGSRTLFLSQMPYIPLGILRVAVAYPATVGDVTDEQISAALEKVMLGHLVGRLDDLEDWAKILSPGEQQRIAFARILLIRPDAVFLDEATSAVDEGLEYTLYNLVKNEVPSCIIFSIGHRSTIDQHHDRRLELTGSGGWELEPI